MVEPRGEPCSTVGTGALGIHVDDTDERVATLLTLGLVGVKQVGVGIPRDIVGLVIRVDDSLVDRIWYTTGRLGILVLPLLEPPIGDCERQEAARTAVSVQDLCGRRGTDTPVGDTNQVREEDG